MAGQLLLINPRKRRASGGKKRTRRTAAQRAATARMLAANRSKRRRNPAPRRAAARRAYNPVVRHVKRRARRRSNPSSRPASLRLTTSSLMNSAKEAGIAAGGAIAVDVAFGYLKGYLPASMQTPADTAGAMNPLYFLAKGLAAVLLGIGGSKVVGARTAAKMAEGSLTVTAYTVLRGFVPSSISMGYYQPAATDTPNLPGSLNAPGRVSSITDMRAYVAGQGSNATRVASRAYDNPGMGAYVSGYGRR